jgi:preprotein translocase subunit YajC
MKKLYKYTLVTAMIAFICWLAYTTFFIIRDGWHISPVSEEEMYCDLGFNLVVWLVKLSLVFMGIMMLGEYIMNRPDSKEEKEINQIGEEV